MQTSVISEWTDDSIDKGKAVCDNEQPDGWNQANPFIDLDDKKFLMRFQLPKFVVEEVEQRLGPQLQPQTKRNHALNPVFMILLTHTEKDMQEAGVKKNVPNILGGASMHQNKKKMSNKHGSYNTYFLRSEHFFIGGAQCDVHSWQCIPLPFGIGNHALFEIDLVVLDNQTFRGFRFEERAGQGVGPPQSTQRS
ncbi:hypothetical protein ANN_04652 [Periplaneta americana]|uniref:Uncharacterized protein n=1 Tax=Periplaneta americana TaxID=6978 RepID=A0ABQ8T9S2_PERAM|nr:hypothetical protein ANN_04652 [Periplaneta americana]